VDACEGNYPVVVVVDTEVWQMTKFGMFFAVDFTDNDLVEQPEEKTVWLEIYRFTSWEEDAPNRVVVHILEAPLLQSVKYGQGAANYKLIAIKKITYVEGEGIE